MLINHRQITVYLALVAVALVLASGCGGGDGGLSDWAKPAQVTVVSNLSGQILPPVAGASLHESAAFSLLSVEGTRVHIEEKPEFSTVVDSQGKFVIKNLPVGKYHVVAYTVSGTTAYKQRSDLINLTGQFETQELTAALPLVIAPYRVNLRVTSLITDNPVAGAKLSVWGADYITSASGDVVVGPLPAGFWPMRIEAAGYMTAVIHPGFQKQRNAHLRVRLTPLSATERNQAPVVEIEQAFTSVKTNESVTFYAAGFDADGDFITYNWRSTRGSFSYDSGSSVVYTSPASTGTVQITLVAKDSKGAEGVAILDLDILSGSSLPPNPRNQSPLAASDPFPANLADNLGSDIMLRWTGRDPDNDPLSYDLLIATQGADLKVVASNLTASSYRITNLGANQTYFWKVVSRDIYDAVSPDPAIWQFRTGEGSNASPYQPKNPVPEDLAFDQLPSLGFSWTGGDPDPDDTVTYSFYISTDSRNLALVATTRATSYEHGGLALGKTYYWQVIAADNRGRETPSPVWRFSTYSQPNQPPSDPIVVYPASGAVNVVADVQLQWSSEDPDGDPITYDLFVGKTFPLEKIVADLVGPSYLPTQPYDSLSTYYWQVVARDDRGLTNVNSPVWSFKTSDKTNLAPNVPIALNPANNATGVDLRPVFSWRGGDPDGDTVLYDLYLDTEITPAQLVAANLTEERWTPATNLNEGAHYYWRVVARDPSGLERNSQIYSFFARTALDSIAPALISVEPANGAAGVAQTAVVRIVFSEPVRKDTASQALSLSPAVAGNWTWEDDVTVHFMPASPWRLGSYNQLTIASSTVRDLAGNLMANGSVYRFTIDTPVPIPSSHRSSGFPVQADAGVSVKSEVANLSSGSKSYALAVASPDSSSFAVQASRSAQPLITDPGSAFREFERMAAERVPADLSISASLEPSPQASPQVGVSENFYIPAYGSVATNTAFPNNVISATCVGLTDKTAIYVDDAITSPSNTLVAEVRKRFEEGIQPAINDYFGQEPALGPDGENRITILLTDSMAPGILGIFYGVDLSARNPADIQLRESNGRKMLYVTYTEDNDATRYGTMAHEFQHMVNYWQKRLNGGGYEATWLNEGMSKFAEEVCGYGVLQGDENTALLIELSQKEFNKSTPLSLTNWTGLNSYGLSYLFVRFLAQENRYGTTYREVTRSLVSSSKTGTANVAAITGEAFDVTLAKWGLSLYLNRFQSTNSKDYGLSGLNLRGAYSGVTLPGFVPQMVTTSQVTTNLPANGVRCYERTSTGAGSTNIEVISTAGALNLWFFDQRP